MAQDSKSWADSKILTDSEHQTLCRFVGEGKVTAPELKLLYRASRDGFDATDFHRLCDGKGPTVTVLQTPSGSVFGGYASASWLSDHCRYVTAPGSFLFTLRNTRSLPPRVFASTDPQHTIGCDWRWGPTFCSLNAYNLCVGSQANANSKSLSILGASYALPAGCTDDLLAGTRQFYVSEWEVFGRRGTRTRISQCSSECSSVLFCAAVV
jgi:hypothetical protein